MARKYGKIDISVLEIIPHTCSNTENPPNPNKKAEIIIFVEIFLIGILETIFIPFVSSIIPEIMPFEKLVGIFKAERIGFIVYDKASNKWLLFKIDIITENRTTKPPIIITVEIALFMLVVKTSPKLENVASFFSVFPEGNLFKV